MLKRLLIIASLFLVVLNSRAQMMEEDVISKIGIRAGFGLNWLPGDKINVNGAADRYVPTPRVGFSASIYNRLRLTKVFKEFNYRSNIQNWYFQYEVGASFRGGNYNYKVKNSNGSYTSSEKDLFRKISTFNIETPLLFVWDVANKQKVDVLFGFQPAYTSAVEIFKGKDYSPLYFNDENYDSYIQFNKWNFSGMLGTQIKAQYVGFQFMFRYGFTNLNNKIALTLDTNGKPEKFLPGVLKPLSFDICLVF